MAMWRRPHRRRSATSSTGQCLSEGASPRARAAPTSARADGGNTVPAAPAHRIASQPRSPDMCRGWAKVSGVTSGTRRPEASAAAIT